MLFGLFISSFLAATLLPGGSEALLLLLLNEHSEQVIAMVIVASIGNSLGSLTSYGLGYLGRIKLKAKEQQSLSAKMVKRYGVYTLLLSWLPVVGDLLCVVAGYLKLPLLKSSLLIFIGKSARYSAIAWLYFNW